MRKGMAGKNNTIRIIAGVLSACVLFANPVFAADGKYDGSDSFFEKTSDDNDTINSYETIYHYNILEIVRGEGMGTIGYLIDGLEPMPADTPEMRHACMDALMNTVNGGSSVGEKPNAVRNFESKLSSDKKPFEVISKESGYVGYYKYVGDNKGFYYVDKSTYDAGSHSVKAYSKFYNYTKSRTYDYIWVDSDKENAQQIIDSDETTDNDYVVDHHQKYKYVNKNTFFTALYNPQEYDADADEYKNSSFDEWKKNHKVDLRTVPCGELTDDDIEWADLIILSNGDGDQVTEAYNIYKYAHPERNNSSNPFPDKNSMPAFEIKSFAQALKIYDRVVAREDVSIVFDVKNITGGTGVINNNLRKLIAMLFRVDKVNSSYQIERCAGRDMFMDYLKSYVEEKKTAPGLRIDATSNSYNKLDKENGYMYQDFPRAIKGTDEELYESNVKLENQWYYDSEKKRHDVPNGTYDLSRVRSNTTDYIYIEENGDNAGNFMVDIRYSGRIFFVDFDNNLGNFKHRFVSWTGDNKLSSKNNSSTWPWDRDGKCLKYWWFHNNVTDQNAHTPLYFQYYSSDNYSWGKYRAYESDGDNLECAYKNQSFSYENVLYQNNNMKKAINGRENKREYTDPIHGEKKGTPKHYFLSVNIENGDGVNVVSDSEGKKTGGNKVLYVNDYEMKGSRAITSVPIKFTIRTSENISEIQLIKKRGSVESVLQSFVPVDSNDISIPEAKQTFTCSGQPNLVLENKTDYTEGVGDSRKPTKDVAHNNLYIYTFKDYKMTADGKTVESIGMNLSANDFKNSSNNKFILRVFVRPDKYVDDEIFVVKRGFFELN